MKTIEDLIDYLIDAAYNSGYYSRGTDYKDLLQLAIENRERVKKKLLEEIKESWERIHEEYEEAEY